MLVECEPVFYAVFVKVYDENVIVIELVCGVIECGGIGVEFVYCVDYDTVAGFDLVVLIGGDGMLFDVSYLVLNRLFLGVCSFKFFVGYFCVVEFEEVGDMLVCW